ncbi:MAG: hypothetical protein CMH30_01425 [Micavibrio sp.]|nr:hypothetical protein [Micavibrio sp.]
MHIVLSFLLCFFFTMSVDAQEAATSADVVQGQVEELGLSFLREQSGVETVGMSYYKTAKIQPDFKDWAQRTDKIKETPIYDRELAATSEFNRLQNKFANFESDTPIIIHASIDLNRYSERQETLFLPYFYPELYFPYDVYGMPVAVLVQNIDRFREIYLPGADAETMFSKADGSTKALVEITLLPILADHERTLQLDPEDKTGFHPMLMKVAQMAIWTVNEPQIPLWVWRDPEYSPKEDKELLNLYKK